MSSSTLGRQVARSALALLAGYIVIVAVQMALTVAFAVVWGIDVGPASGVVEQPPMSFSVVLLGVGVAAAALGGYTSARLAGIKPVLHGWILGGCLFVGGAAYQLAQFWTGLETDGAKEPLWYLLLLPGLGLVGALLGSIRVARLKEKE